jgi:hypothetical protein
MTQRPNRYLEHFRAMAILEPGEKYVGAFLGRTQVRLIWFFVMGPLALLTMRQYQIIVSDRRIFFLRLSKSGRSAGVDAFTFDEIGEASFKKGVMTYKIFFRFRNGRALNLESNHKALVRVEGLLFDDNLRTHLERVLA